MKLDDWLSEHEISDDAFGALVGVDRTTVSRWRRGLRFPRPDQLRRISDVTAGAVSASDLLELSATSVNAA